MYYIVLHTANKCINVCVCPYIGLAYNIRTIIKYIYCYIHVYIATGIIYMELLFVQFYLLNLKRFSYNLYPQIA